MKPIIKLRSYQKEVLRQFDRGVRWIVLRWSRRAGKSLFAWNLLIREAISKPGTYWYCFNNYSTAYNDIWLAMTSKGVKFLDMIPNNLVVRLNSSKLEIELINGSIIKLIGINNVDKLVGAGLNGVVFDEYAVLNPNSIELVTAMLGETGGWRVIISTPRGKNHFHDAYYFAENHPEFAYVMTRTVEDEGVGQYMAPGFLEQERLQIISKYGNDALYRQEYLCSWESPNSGSVFGDLMRILKEEGRVQKMYSKPEHIFYTAWDLGNADNTSIVLCQVDDRGYPQIVDHIENRNEDVSWYVGEMKARGWHVQTHFLPHDAKHRKGARNETYKQVLSEQHGIRNTIVLPKPNRVEDKLNHLRRKFKGLIINEGLDRLIECLDKLEYEWNEKQHIWSNKPTHAHGYSDTVDSLAYMCQAIEKYNIVGSKPFKARAISGGTKPRTADEKFEDFMKAELMLGGNKKDKTGGSISIFI